MLKVFAFILSSLSTNNAIKADGIIFNCFPLYDTIVGEIIYSIVKLFLSVYWFRRHNVMVSFSLTMSDNRDVDSNFYSYERMYFR